MEEKLIFFVTVTARWQNGRPCKTVGSFDTTIYPQYLEYEFEERLKHNDWDDHDLENTKERLSNALLRKDRPFYISVSCFDARGEARPNMAKKAERKLATRVGITKSKSQFTQYW